MASREHSSIARLRQQKPNNGGFRRFATWTLSLTCASADIGVWLLGSQTIVGEFLCFDWGFGSDGRVMITD